MTFDAEKTKEWLSQLSREELEQLALTQSMMNAQLLDWVETARKMQEQPHED